MTELSYELAVDLVGVVLFALGVIAGVIRL